VFVISLHEVMHFIRDLCTFYFSSKNLLAADGKIVSNLCLLFFTIYHFFELVSFYPEKPICFTYHSTVLVIFLVDIFTKILVLFIFSQ